MPDQSPQRNSPGATRRRGWEHKAGSGICLEGLRFTRLHKRFELCPMHQQILNWIHFHETLLLEDNNSVAQCVLVFTFFGMFGLLKTELTCLRANQYNRHVTSSARTCGCRFAMNGCESQQPRVSVPLVCQESPFFKLKC